MDAMVQVEALGLVSVSAGGIGSRNAAGLI